MDKKTKLICIACKAALEPGSFLCNKCHNQYGTEDNIPILLGEIDSKKWQTHFRKAALRKNNTPAAVDRSPKLFFSMQKMIKEIFEQIEEQKILDVGCGNGLLTEFFIKKNHVTGVDFAQEMLSIAANKGFEVFCANATCLPFEKNQFDMVFCMETYQIINDKENLCSELSRVCSKKGMVIVSFLNGKSLVRHLFRTCLKPMLKKVHTPLPETPKLHLFADVVKQFEKYGLRLFKTGKIYFPTGIYKFSDQTNNIDQHLISNYILVFKKKERI